MDTNDAAIFHPILINLPTFATTMRYEYIGFARGYAIFTIIVFHALQRLALPGIWAKAIVFGGTGVHLFFLLSGFGLALSDKTENIRSFYLRRFSKVWWPYVLVLTLSWGLAASIHLFPDGWEAWLAGAGLYQMFFERYIESFGGHFWFISAIFQFYIVFPFLKNGLDRSSSLRGFVAAGLVISFCWWVLVAILDKGAMRTWNSCFLQFLWEFMLGMAIARALKRVQAPGKWLAVARHFWQPASWLWWLAAGAFAAVLMLLMELKGGTTGHLMNDVPALAGYGMISVGIYFLAKRHLPFVFTFFSWVGSFSYALYLIHIIALDLLIAAIHGWGWGFHIAVIPVFLGFAFLLGLGLERVIQWVNYSAGSPQR